MTETKRQNQSMNRRFEPRTRWVSIRKSHLRVVTHYMRVFGSFTPIMEDMDTLAKMHDKTMWFYVLDGDTLVVQEDHWEDTCNALIDHAGGLNKLREDNPGLYEIVQPQDRKVINGDRVRQLIEARFDKDLRDEG